MLWLVRMSVPCVVSRLSRLLIESLGGQEKGSAGFHVAVCKGTDSTQEGSILMT